MDDIVKRIRQQSYFGLEPYEAADEIEQLRQRVAELEKERDRLSGLCDKWNFECDEMREDNKRLANVADALKQQRDELLAVLGSGGRHCNDDTPHSNLCEAIIDSKEADLGQGLDPFWKWAFRRGNIVQSRHCNARTTARRTAGGAGENKDALCFTS